VDPPPGVRVAYGERVLGVFAHADGVHFDYHRFSGADVTYAVGGPGLFLGTPGFVTGVALGTVIRRARARRDARALAAPQWRPSNLTCAAVTTHRLWCQIDHQRWLHFDYDTVTDLSLQDWSLTLRFAEADPLRLTGLRAPWVAVAIAHHTYDRDTVTKLAGLASLRPAPRAAVHSKAVTIPSPRRRTRS
jgi:hypothetical protein